MSTSQTSYLVISPGLPMCSYPLFGSCRQTEIRANLIVHICLFLQCVLRRRDGETECEFQQTQILVSASSCVLFKRAPWLSAAPLCKEAAPVMIDSMKQKLLVPHSLFFISLCSSLFTVSFGRILSVQLLSLISIWVGFRPAGRCRGSLSRGVLPFSLFFLDLSHSFPLARSLSLPLQDRHTLQHKSDWQCMAEAACFSSAQRGEV